MLHRAKRGGNFLQSMHLYTAFFQRYKLSDLPNRPVKYLENDKIERTDFVVVPMQETVQLSLLVVVSVKMCINIATSYQPTSQPRF